MCGIGDVVANDKLIGVIVVVEDQEPPGVLDMGKLAVDA